MITVMMSTAITHMHTHIQQRGEAEKTAIVAQLKQQYLFSWKKCLAGDIGNKSPYKITERLKEFLHYKLKPQ